MKLDPQHTSDVVHVLPLVCEVVPVAMWQFFKSDGDSQFISKNKSNFVVYELASTSSMDNLGK